MSAQIDNLPRKQRELLQREQLILDAAQNMLHTQGYAHLTMDRLADAVEYSKGTLYNHFSSKEDLVCSLCCRYIGSLIELFNRAYNYEGTTRERFSAIGIAYTTYHQLHPLDAQNIQIVKTNAVREKLSEEKLAEMTSLEQEITHICIKLVEEAINNGDIPPGKNISADSIVFGFWSMQYGGMLLAQSDIPLDDLGFSPVTRMIWNNSQSLMDAYGWQPLCDGVDCDALFEKLSTALFPNEVKELNREINHG